MSRQIAFAGMPRTDAVQSMFFVSNGDGPRKVVTAATHDDWHWVRLCNGPSWGFKHMSPVFFGQTCCHSHRKRKDDDDEFTRVKVEV